MRENRPSGSEGGVAFGPSLPLSMLPGPGSGEIAEAHRGGVKHSFFFRYGGVPG